jgi:hypothetical protein
MTEMPTEFRADDADPGPRINGVIDVSRPGRAGGWAIDRADEAAAVTVTVLREGRVIGEVRADAHRPDLERGGIGTGRYGFAVTLDPPLEPGFEFTVTAVARADDGTTGSLRQVGRARGAASPERRLMERTFTEITALHATVAGIARRQAKGAEAELAGMLDRIEVVQARIETALPAPETNRGVERDRSLAVAVAAALVVGTCSLALGIWTMLAG